MLVSSTSPAPPIRHRGSNDLFVIRIEYFALGHFSMANSELLIVARPSPHVVEVSLNRPSKLNAYSPALCDALVDTLTSLAKDTEAYVLVLRGEGKHFCAGLDFGEATSAITPTGDDAARISLKMRAAVDSFQKPCDLLAKLPQVTIACVHGACVGAGVDLAAACDIRYCSEDAKFSIKEVDVGLAADLGSLHRVPMISGNMSWVRELAFTGRPFSAEEAPSPGPPSAAGRGSSAAASHERTRRRGTSVSQESSTARQPIEDPEACQNMILGTNNRSGDTVETQVYIPRASVRKNVLEPSCGCRSELWCSSGPCWTICRVLANNAPRSHGNRGTASAIALSAANLFNVRRVRTGELARTHVYLRRADVQSPEERLSTSVPAGCGGGAGQDITRCQVPRGLARNEGDVLLRGGAHTRRVHALRQG
ncbi:unnamed protein product, partial [Prorocentrum cordatum]